MTTSPAAAAGAAARRAGGAVLEAVLERITYANEETGYTIARVATDRSGADLLTVVGRAAGRAAGGEPAAGGPVGLAPAVRQAVRGRVLHHGAAGHDPGHPALPRLGADQGDRPADRRPDRRALRRGHPAGDRGGAGAAGRGAGPGPEAHRDDRRRVGGAEGHQGGDGLPAGRRGVHLARGADLQEVRRRLDLGGAERAVPAGRRRVGHRVQDRRHDRPGGRDPARQPAAGQGRPPVHPVRRPPTTGTATCPSRT